MSDCEYWIAPSGMKSFAVFKKNGMGMVSRVGIYRSAKKAGAVVDSLRKPIPHVKP